jgi:hypothetical protein
MYNNDHVNHHFFLGLHIKKYVKKLACVPSERLLPGAPTSGSEVKNTALIYSL